MEQLVQVGSISGQSLGACLKGKARQKASEILSSMNGNLSEPQRKLLKMQLEHLKDLQSNLLEVEKEIRIGFSKFQVPIELLELNSWN